MVTQETPQVFLGLDVGKTKHWACAVTEGQKVIWNKALPNDEAKLIDMYTRLQEQGSLLVVVDQPATIRALAVAVAQHMGIPVAYLPGLTMRRIADLYPWRRENPVRKTHTSSLTPPGACHTPYVNSHQPTLMKQPWECSPDSI